MKNKTKIILFVSLIVVMILPFSNMELAEANKIDDKSLVKEKLKDKMVKLADKDKNEKFSKKKLTSHEYGIPYNMMFESEGKLVVGIDANKANKFNKTYSNSDVKADLNTDVDLEVRYFVFERETTLRGTDGLTNTEEELATITVVKNDKIVTTGHAYALNDIVAAGSSYGGTACTEIEITKDSNPTGSYADAAYGVDIDNPNCDNDYINDSIKHNGKNYSVTYGTASDITFYKYIRMAGMTTQSSGYILDTDVTVRDGDDVIHDQVVGNYSSAGGDSGAPVYSIIGYKSAKLLGQHIGKFCEVDLHSGTNYGSWCNISSSGLVIFSPWDQVASHLGI